MLRALAAQERQATRQRSRETAGPKDDEDIEWEQLMEAHHQAGYVSLVFYYHSILHFICNA